MRVCVNVSSHLSRMCLPRSWAGRGRGMNQSCRCRCLHFHMAQTDSHRHLQRRGKMGENNRYVDSRRIAVMLKGKIIRTVVRSAMIYGWETVVNNRQKAEVEEMKMWYIYIYIYKYTFYTLNTIHILVFKGHFCSELLLISKPDVQHCTELCWKNAMRIQPVTLYIPAVFIPLTQDHSSGPFHAFVHPSLRMWRT